jgi:hypothetical protein
MSFDAAQGLPLRPGRAPGRPPTVLEKTFYALFLALATTGYPIAGLVTSILQIEGSTASYAFRVTVITMGALVAGSALFHGRMRAVPLAVILFFVMYAIRLYHDTFLDYLIGADTTSLFFIAVVLLPTIGTGLGFDNYDETYHAWATFLVAGLASAGVVSFQMLGMAQYFGETGNTERISFEALNPITIGYAGLFTMLAAAALWQRAPKDYRPLLVIGALIGLYSLIESASRGPLVSGLACVAFIALARGRIVLFGFLMLFAAYGALFLSDANLALFSRLRSTGTDLSSMERIAYMQNAIDQAFANPLFGHAFIETTSYNFPHNLFIESALAMGMFGLALMIYLQASMLVKAAKLARAGLTLVPLLVVSAFMNAQLSASIWSSVEFWIPLTLTLMIARVLRKSTSQAERKPLPMSQARASL